MEFLSYQLRKKFPEEVASALANRFAASTIKQYQSHWKVFQKYYREEIQGVFRKKDALFFLLKLFQKGAANRTLSVVKAALKDPWLYGWKIDIADLEFTQLSMYFGRQRPLIRRPPPQWDLSSVLNMLRVYPFKDYNTMTESRLLIKTLFLVSLAAGARVGELSALSRREDNIIWDQNSTAVTLIPRADFCFKSHRLQKIPVPIVLPAFFRKEARHHSLCPVAALKSYVDKTHHWSNPNKVLWLHPVSHKPLNSRGLSYFFKAAIRLSQSEDHAISFHQIRKVATSLAFQQGLSIAEICRRARWNSNSVFFKHYYNPNKDRLPSCIALGFQIG